jgi:hypothetical protein
MDLALSLSDLVGEQHFLGSDRLNIAVYYVLRSLVARIIS